MKRIVVGIDGSEQGWSALAKAGDLARATGAGLQIAHVSPPVPWLFAAVEYQYGAPGWIEAQEKFAKGLLREAVARVKDAGVEVDAVNKFGPPAEALAELAESADVTMTVVGHRGRNLATRLLIGSVADRLVQLSPKPVLVNRGQWSMETEEVMKRIVVGIDGSEQGWSALAKAAELARATGAGLQIAHVSAPVVSPLGEWVADARLVEAHEKLAQELLREAVARVKDAGVEVSTVVKTGTPAESLAELAEPADVTMAVVGHRGRNLASRLLVGSVADRLVQISRKPVLVIR